MRIIAKYEFPDPVGTIENPQLGDVRIGREIDMLAEYMPYVRQACVGCGKQRWIEVRGGKPRAMFCRYCSANDPKKKEKTATTRIRRGLQTDTPIPKGTLEAPQLGDMRRAKEIGKTGWKCFIWYACPVCGKQYWTSLRDARKLRKCHLCSTRDSTRKDKATATRLKRGTEKEIPVPQGTIEVPILGDIRRGNEIGLISNATFIWRGCQGCGKEQWVYTSRLGVFKTHCHRCAAAGRRGKKLGSSCPMWKGGRYVTTQGYVMICIHPDDFFHPMCFKGGNHMQEHRYVMAKKLGRLLHSWEDVHHKDLNRQNNDPSNLELKMKGHGAGTTSKFNIVVELERTKKRVAQLEARVSLLEAENVLLKENVLR